MESQEWEQLAPYHWLVVVAEDYGSGFMRCPKNHCIKLTGEDLAEQKLVTIPLYCLECDVPEAIPDPHEADSSNDRAS